MDRKQRKAKKREEKVKKQKMRKLQEQNEGITTEQKKSGNLQLMIFFGVAILGAVIIIFNV